MVDIEQLKKLIVEQVQTIKDATLLDLIFKLLLSESRQ